MGCTTDVRNRLSLNVQPEFRMQNTETVITSMTFIAACGLRIKLSTGSQGFDGIDHFLLTV